MPHKCLICGKQFSNSQNARRHVRTKHEKQGNHPEDSNISPQKSLISHISDPFWILDICPIPSSIFWEKKSESQVKNAGIIFWKHQIPEILGIRIRINSPNKSYNKIWLNQKLFLGFGSEKEEIKFSKISFHNLLTEVSGLFSGKCG